MGILELKLRYTGTSKNFIPFLLKNPRKFDLKTFNTIKDKEYVKKVSF